MRILEGAGLEVVAGQEAFPETAFYDIGAVVYYLRAIPWQVPDFRVEKYTRTLRALHCQIKQEGQWVVRGHRFYLEAWRR
jgi:hypothetical protein